MITIVLVNPEIPPNTGNIGRLALGTGAELVIVGEPSFDLDANTAVKRAGLDYWEDVDPLHYTSWERYLDETNPNRRYLVTKFADTTHTTANYTDDTHLIFGGETRGAPQKIHDAGEVDSVAIPMNPEGIRSYNLANSVAIVLFEALRQTRSRWSEEPPFPNRVPASEPSPSTSNSPAEE